MVPGASRPQRLKVSRWVLDPLPAFFVVPFVLLLSGLTVVLLSGLPSDPSWLVAALILGLLLFITGTFVADMTKIRRRA